MKAAKHAGAMAGACLVLVVALGGCSAQSDRKAVKALVERLMAVLESKGGADGAAELAELFVRVDGSPEGEPSAAISAMPRITAYRITGLVVLPAGKAAVTVKVSGRTTTTLSLTATKVDDQWKLEPEIGVTQQIGDVIRAEP